MPPNQLREGVFPLLQPPLNRLFIPRPKLDYLPPLDAEPGQRKGQHFDDVSAFMSQFEELCAADTPKPILSKQERREKRLKKYSARLSVRIQSWKNRKTDALTKEPYLTVFVGRLAYSIDEKMLEREFAVYGPVTAIQLVRGKGSKSRGYAFIQYESENGLRNAFQRADGMRLEGRRIVVDVERGRTVRDWLPRRLGGGLGKTRVGPANRCVKASGRDPSLSAPIKPPPPISRPRPRYEDEIEPGEVLTAAPSRPAPPYQHYYPTTRY